MKQRDRYLSGILLVLIGVIIGTLIAYYNQQNNVDPHAEVDVTEVKHSNEPAFTDQQLSKLDDRFLFKKVSQKVTPTVVYIRSEVLFSEDDMPDDDIHDKEKDSFWKRQFPRHAQSVGTGVIISSDGYILTNNHVISDADDGDIKVTLNDKRSFKAQIVGKDPTTDLAVLKVNTNDLSAITFGNSGEVDVGEWVLAVGNPFRLRSTVTAGIVSALSRDVRIINDRMRVENFIQTDAAINKGNSGGPLVNTSGELVGINTAIASQSGNYQGYGFAVPSNLASKVSQDLIEYGEVHRALLGVTIVTVNDELADRLDMDTIRGVAITGISPTGAAAKAGLQTEDVVLKIDGDIINKSNQLQQKIAIKHPGDSVEMTILRDDKTLAKRVELQAMPSLSSQEKSYSRSVNPREEDSSDREDAVQFREFEIGIKVMAVKKKSDKQSFDLIITGIKAKSMAEESGLGEGYRIKEVNDQKVEDLESLGDILEEYKLQDKPLTLTVETKGGHRKQVTLNY